MIDNNWITISHTEEDFKTAELFPKETEKKERSTWRVVSKTWNAMTDYVKSVGTDVPQLNKNIRTISTMAKAKLEQHHLADASFEQLELWQDETKQILENINTHDRMTARFAVDHLFLGANSPILGGYGELRKELKAHIDDIFDQMLVAVKTPVLKVKEAEKPAEVRPNFGPDGIMDANQKVTDILIKVVAEKGIPIDDFDPDFKREVMIAKCSVCKLRPNLEDPHFEEYLEMHYKLYFSSPTYHDMINQIAINGPASYSKAARDDLITISSQTTKDFEFEGCWNATKHSVMITRDHPRMLKEDSSEVDPEAVKELIPFEMTNALQQARFEEVERRANQRAFEEPSGLDADQYALAMENIEDEGLRVFMQIAHEAGPELVPLNRWGEKWRGKRRLGNILNSHGEHYRSHYREKIRPILDDIPDSLLTRKQRRYREIQRNHWIPKLEG